ncbi:MAG: HDOD domain-containing protein [Pseudomonadota bacterium]
MGHENELPDGSTLSNDVCTLSKPTVLFVDDEDHVLNGLRRFMRTRRDAWTSMFASGGADAIDKLSETEVDLVVTDMRMPGVDGASLLEWISSEQPGTIRFVLSGEANIDETYRIVGRSHQFLGKPCAPEKLAETITSTLLGTWAQDASIGGDTASFLDRLKTHPDVHADLDRCLMAAEADTRDAAAIISTDPGLSARVLQLVNSAYFGRPIETASIERAVNALGLEHLRALTQKGRLGQASADAGTTRWDTVFGPLANSARAHGSTMTNNRDVLDTIYATALFSGLGSIVGDVKGNAPIAPAAFTATLLGFPNKLIAALAALKELRPAGGSTDLVEPICASVFEAYAMTNGGKVNA